MCGSFFTLGIGILLLSSSGGDNPIGWLLTIIGGFSVLGSLNEDDPFDGVDPEHYPQLRVRADTFHPDDDEMPPMPILAVEFKGLLAMPRSSNLSFVTTVFDVTDPDEPKPVLGHYEALQEATTTAYQRRMDIGWHDPGDYATDWLHAGAVFQELVTPPFSGRRKLLVNLFLIDSSNPPAFNLGYTDFEHDGVFWGDGVEYYFTFEQKGYLEAIEDTKKARVLTIKIAMAVAMADGSLDRTEGEILKEYVTRIISTFDGDQDHELKASLNSAMQESYREALDGGLILSDLCFKLNALDLEPQKYETLQLCYDVMAADGIADPNELEVIKQIAGSLQIDADEEARIRDSVLSKISKESFADGTDAILGIDPSWSNKKKMRHLRKEFTKWNARTSLPPPECDEAHRMLDLIAKARQQYDAEGSS